jgi:hypothetical protein
MSKTPVQLKQLTNLPARNLIINGNMDFSQRFGNSRVATAPDYFMTDRFKYYANAGTAAFNWESDVPTFIESGFQSSKSLKLTVGTGTSALYSIRHILEGYDYSFIHGKSVRFQFWVKSSLAGLFSVNFTNNNTTRGYTAPYTINAANTWEKKTIDLTMDTTGTWLFDNQGGVLILWHLTQNGGVTAAINNTWSTVTNYGAAAGQVQLGNTPGATFQLAQVQLIAGDFEGSSIDIPFSRAGKTIQEELAMCQRYYEKSYNQSGVPGTSPVTVAEQISMGCGTNGTNGFTFTIPYKVAKRTLPTLTIYNNSGTSARITEVNSANTTVTVASSTGFTADTSENNFRIYGTFTNAGSGQAAFSYSANAEL